MKQQHELAAPVSHQVNATPVLLLIIPLALSLFGLVNAVIYYLAPGGVTLWMMVSWLITSIIVCVFILLHLIYYMVVFCRYIEIDSMDFPFFAFPCALVVAIYIGSSVGLVINKLFSAFSITLFVLLCVFALIDLLIAFPPNRK